MKKHISPLICLLLFTILLQSCKDESNFEDFTMDFGYDYYPLTVGKFREYQVDSTTYDIGPDGNIIVRNSTTLVREEVADTITDNLGRLAYVLERYERNNPMENWQIKDVWMDILTDRAVERLEENLRFVKMVFPLEDGLDWDGNQYIDETTIIPIAGETVEVFKSWDYEVLSLGEPAVVNNNIFENVVEIQQADNENLIELRYSKEQYAEGIGLVYREMRILDTQCIAACDGMPWEDKAEKGFILTQIILDYN